MPRNHNKLSAKEKLLRAGAVGAIGAVALTGCKGVENVTATPNPSETTQSETTQGETTTPYSEYGVVDNPPLTEWPGMSEIAKQYRDNTTSAKLYEAAKTPGELEKLFAVPDTAANRADYAQIWTALDASEKNAGLNEMDFGTIDELDRINDDFALNRIVTEKYAAIPKVTNSNLNPEYLSNIHGLYTDMASAAITINKDDPNGIGKGKEYQLNETLLPDTVKTTEGADGSFSQTFQMEVSDTWDNELWRKMVGDDRDGMGQTVEVTLTDVAPNEQGNLVPGKVNVADVTERGSTGWS